MVKKSERLSKAEVKERMEKFIQLSRDSGLKVTPQRTAVYKALLKTNEHPSADNIFKSVRFRYPNISLDTVNRTLHTLSDIGLAFIVEGSGDAKRYDANLDDHQHFKCIKCKRIIDCDDCMNDIKVPADIAGKFKVLRKTVYFEGLCDKCK